MLDIKVDLIKDVTRINLFGRIDSISAALFEGKCEELKASQGKYLLDFSEVDFISSRGLWSLIEFRKAVVEMDGAMAMVGLSDDLKALLFTVGLTHLFTIRPSLDDGLEFLQQAGQPGALDS
jgi:anti-anti-sigma factor